MGPVTCGHDYHPAGVTVAVVTGPERLTRPRLSPCPALNSRGALLPDTRSPSTTARGGLLYGKMVQDTQIKKRESGGALTHPMFKRACCAPCADAGRQK